MTKIKTVEIKEVTKKRDAWDLLVELEATGVALNELSEVLSVVIEFFDEQHTADLKQPITCWNLVQFTQRYNTILKMARDKLDTLDIDIKKIVEER